MTAQGDRNGPPREIQQRQKLLDALRGKLLLWGNELAQQAPARFHQQLSLAEELATQADGPETLRHLLLDQQTPTVGWRHNSLHRTASQHLEAIEQAADGDVDLWQQAAVRYWEYARLSYLARQLAPPRR
jgi:DNA-binding GntR family transcriptional regulator